MSAIAKVLLGEGIKVSGSDNMQSKATLELEALGAEIFIGQCAENIKNPDLVVYTAAIKENNPVKMKKLFNLLNDIYEDGTNETQSVIAVTILGSLENNQELLANCVDYMSEDMTVPVININKYLYSKGGKSARMRLENPPKYKPAKAKKNKGMMSRLGM